MKFPFQFYAILLVILLSVRVLSNAQNLSPAINHVAICAHDLKKSVAFYSEVLQLKKIPNPFKDTVHQWFRIGPGVQLHVIAADCPAEMHDINTHLCFSVASLPGFMRHLDQLGVRYGDWQGHPGKSQVRADGVLQIYFRDPDGYWIEVNNAKP